MANSIHLFPLPDLLLTLYLLLVFPLQRLWRSLHSAPRKPPRPPLRTYWKQTRFVLVLLAALVAAMWTGGHSVADLGLAFPLTSAAAWGLAIASGVLLALHLAGKRMENRMTPAQHAAQEARLQHLPFVMPRTALDTAAYLASSVLMTAAWEILFRGYLLLVVPPVTGLPVALALAAIAYGAAHGYKNPRQFAGSIAASFAFAIGYALTSSLWWLIVLHAAAPVTMLFTVKKIQARAARAAASASAA